MGATSIFQNNYENIREMVEEIVMCMTDKDLMFRKMGLANNFKSEEIDLILYLYDLLEHRFCEIDFDDECFLDRVSTLYHKYV